MATVTIVTKKHLIKYCKYLLNIYNLYISHDSNLLKALIYFSKHGLMTKNSSPLWGERWFKHFSKDNK